MSKTPGSGRKKGTPNKATVEIKAIAQLHGPEAIAQLVRLMKSAKNEQARIAAAKELLDRAYGKSTQPLASDLEHPPFPDRIEMVVVKPAIDRPPQETREEWVTRRRRELESG